MDDDVEGILEVLADGAPRLSGRVGITVHEIRGAECACCGQPAKASFYHLRRRERTLLCGACRPSTRPSATPTSTAK